ncbi:IS66-like element accessory protein TnpA [Serratia marcescens]|uniref:IS66-like element accessory protein TnpA n=1 Tax=Serratia marcescens TaxID=615 RepID=UPI0027321AB8|nr:IS66-like element accessory protein TnpA [Serratia marcescens]MDP0522208.1 IS66-like element accessory protein TnpA [Serratia marcescens]
MSERAWLIEAFRLHYQEQLSQNRIAKQLGLPRSMVNSCFQRAGKAEVRCPVNKLTLERTLYPGKKRSRSSASSPLQTPITTVSSKPKKRGRRPNFPLAFKLSLVEKSMQPSVSTARLVREHGINDNLLFNWRNLYKQGLLGATIPAEPCLLPVELEDVPSPPPITKADKASPSNVAGYELVLPGGTLRLRGALSPALLNILIHELKGTCR